MAAAKGGAITTSVDLASRSLDKTRENFEINNIDYNKHEIVVQDIFLYFKEAIRDNKKFDVVILDPPSFATSKDNRFSASHDYKDLVKDAIDMTEDEGVIVCSTNCASFNMKKFKKFIDDAFKEKQRDYSILEEYTLPEDFVVTEKFIEGNYLKVVFVKMH
jgi:23S rRNA (cytosine1962-C5)-methyltransferase